MESSNQINTTTDPILEKNNKLEAAIGYFLNSSDAINPVYWVIPDDKMFDWMYTSNKNELAELFANKFNDEQKRQYGELFIDYMLSIPPQETEKFNTYLFSFKSLDESDNRLKSLFKGKEFCLELKLDGSNFNQLFVSHFEELKEIFAENNYELTIRTQLFGYFIKPIIQAVCKLEPQTRENNLFNNLLIYLINNDHEYIEPTIDAAYECYLDSSSVSNIAAIVVQQLIEQWRPVVPKGSIDIAGKSLLMISKLITTEKQKRAQNQLTPILILLKKYDVLDYYLQLLKNHNILTNQINQLNNLISFSPSIVIDYILNTDTPLSNAKKDFIIILFKKIAYLRSDLFLTKEIQIEMLYKASTDVIQLLLNISESISTRYDIWEIFSRLTEKEYRFISNEKILLIISHHRFDFDNTINNNKDFRKLRIIIAYREGKQLLENNLKINDINIINQLKHNYYDYFHLIMDQLQIIKPELLQLRIKHELTHYINRINETYSFDTDDKNRMIIKALFLDWISDKQIQINLMSTDHQENKSDFILRFIIDKYLPWYVGSLNTPSLSSASKANHNKNNQDRQNKHYNAYEQYNSFSNHEKQLLTLDQIKAIFLSSGVGSKASDVRLFCLDELCHGTNMIQFLTSLPYQWRINLFKPYANYLMKKNYKELLVKPDIIQEIVTTKRSSFFEGCTSPSVIKMTIDPGLANQKLCVMPSINEEEAEEENDKSSDSQDTQSSTSIAIYNKPQNIKNLLIQFLYNNEGRANLSILSIIKSVNDLNMFDNECWQLLCDIGLKKDSQGKSILSPDDRRTIQYFLLLSHPTTHALIDYNIFDQLHSLNEKFNSQLLDELANSIIAMVTSRTVHSSIEHDPHYLTTIIYLLAVPDMFEQINTIFNHNNNYSTNSRQFFNAINFATQSFSTSNYMMKIIYCLASISDSNYLNCFVTHLISQNITLIFTEKDIRYILARNNTAIFDFIISRKDINQFVDIMNSISLFSSEEIPGIINFITNLNSIKNSSTIASHEQKDILSKLSFSTVINHIITIQKELSNIFESQTKKSALSIFSSKSNLHIQPIYYKQMQNVIIGLVSSKFSTTINSLINNILINNLAEAKHIPVICKKLDELFKQIGCAVPDVIHTPIIVKLYLSSLLYEYLLDINKRKIDTHAELRKPMKIRFLVGLIKNTDILWHKSYQYDPKLLTHLYLDYYVSSDNYLGYQGTDYASVYKSTIDCILIKLNEEYRSQFQSNKQITTRFQLPSISAKDFDQEQLAQFNISEKILNDFVTQILDGTRMKSLLLKLMPMILREALFASISNLDLSDLSFSNILSATRRASDPGNFIRTNIFGSPQCDSNPTAISRETISGHQKK